MLAFVYNASEGRCGSSRCTNIDKHCKYEAKRSYSNGDDAPFTNKWPIDTKMIKHACNSLWAAALLLTCVNADGSRVWARRHGGGHRERALVAGGGRSDRWSLIPPAAAAGDAGAAGHPRRFRDQQAMPAEPGCPRAARHTRTARNAAGLWASRDPRATLGLPVHREPHGVHMALPASLNSPKILEVEQLIIRTDDANHYDHHAVRCGARRNYKAAIAIAMGTVKSTRSYLLGAPSTQDLTRLEHWGPW